MEKDILVCNAIENIKGLREELVEIEKRMQEVSEENKKEDESGEEEVTGI